MKRLVLVCVLLLITAAVSFLLPKPKYTSLNVLEDIYIPAYFPGWRSRDVSKELNLKDDRYNFISNISARLYENRKGDQLLFLILDAGNFHNPRVCYKSSGFTVKDLGTVNFKAQDKKFKANALAMERQNMNVNMFYWLCIDKKIVDWTGQKILELWSSLFNNKKAGLMVRIEIFSKNGTPQQAFDLGHQFIADLSKALSEKQKEYLFGKSD